jgi:hypothetical protein
MRLHRTTLLLTVLEQASVPVGWPTKVGYPPPGVTRKTSYPAGLGDSAKGGGIDDEYPCTPEGKKLANSHAWMFPGKRIKVCGKILKV